MIAKTQSNYEPDGSQRYQYNGAFTPFIPPSREPVPAKVPHEGAANALRR